MSYTPTQNYLFEYNYTYSFYTFGDRPEIWVRVSFEAAQDSQLAAEWTGLAKFAMLPFTAMVGVNGFQRDRSAAPDWYRFDDDTEDVGVTWAPVHLAANMFYNYAGTGPSDTYAAASSTNTNFAKFSYDASEVYDATTVVYDATAGEMLIDNNLHLFMLHNGSESTADTSARSLALRDGVATSVGTASAMP